MGKRHFSRRSLLVAFVCTLGLILPHGIFAQAFPAEIDLTQLDGSDGFELSWLINGFRFGKFASNAGDLNADGYDDLVIDGLSPNQSFIILGSPNVGGDGVLSIDDIGREDIIELTNATRGGRLVSDAGDVNSDGYDDVVIAGEGGAYVAFGGPSFGVGGTLDLGALDGANGFAFSSSREAVLVGDAGDLNNDGVDDLVFGAPEFSSSGDDGGVAYVLFGGAGIGAGGQIDESDLDGGAGFVIRDQRSRAFFGISVDGAGDINADGIDDLLIGSSYAIENDEALGAAYVLFGAETVGSSGLVELENLSPDEGFTLFGLNDESEFGYSVSRAGDINDDGVSDLIVGAPGRDQAFVVFGSDQVVSDLQGGLAGLDGTNGFVMTDAAGGFIRLSVSFAGDLNADGIDDVVVGAPSGEGGVSHLWIC